jgi:hypothetical protein
VQTHVERFPAKEGKSIRWFLASDLHIGHVCCDVRRIQREFTRALELGAKILVNGDVFDAVTTGDKRYTPGQTVSRIADAKDALAATVDLGFEILAPFANSIRVIGVGNHEESWIKFRQSDPVAWLIERLSTHSGQHIRHGGISGYIVSLLDIPSGKGKPLTLSHRLLYHHGIGGDSPVTKGTIDINRRSVAFSYDAVTFGHKHNRLVMDDVYVDVRPNGRIVFKPRVAIQTGSYFRNIKQGVQGKEWEANYAKYIHAGEKAGPIDYSYAESSWHAAKPFGGTVLVLTPERESRGGAWRIRQDHHSALLPMEV